MTLNDTFVSDFGGYVDVYVDLQMIETQKIRYLRIFHCVKSHPNEKTCN